MPEPPDFEQMARRLLDDLPDAFLTRGASASVAMPGVVEQFRLIWNARGAADLATIDVAIALNHPDILAQITTLDR